MPWPAKRPTSPSSFWNPLRYSVESWPWRTSFVCKQPLRVQRGGFELEDTVVMGCRTHQETAISEYGATVDWWITRKPVNDKICIFVLALHQLYMAEVMKKALTCHVLWGRRIFITTDINISFAVTYVKAWCCPYTYLICNIAYLASNLSSGIWVRLVLMVSSWTLVSVAFHETLMDPQCKVTIPSLQLSTPVG
jgi:hypothetical protein